MNMNIEKINEKLILFTEDVIFLESEKSANSAIDEFWDFIKKHSGDVNDEYLFNPYKFHFKNATPMISDFVNDTVNCMRVSGILELTNKVLFVMAINLIRHNS